MRINSLEELSIGDRVHIKSKSGTWSVDCTVKSAPIHGATSILRSSFSVDPGGGMFVIYADEINSLFFIDTIGIAPTGYSPVAVAFGSTCRGGCDQGLNIYAESDRGDGTHVCWSCKQRGAK